MLEEPYGTVVIMDAIELWLRRSFIQTPSSHEIMLMPKLIDMMALVIPHVKTEAILKAFARLISLESIGFFDDYSFASLSLNATETLTRHPPRTLLSQFSLTYVGTEYGPLINRLLTIFTDALNTRAQSMSNSMLSSLMHIYFDKSQELSVSISTIKPLRMFSMPTSDNKVDESFTSARMAYFLFTLKANRDLYLSSDDYRVMLHFYHTYLNRQLTRFEKGSSLYNHQRRVCLSISEISLALVERMRMPEDQKLALIASKEYKLFQLAYENLAKEKVVSCGGASSPP